MFKALEDFRRFVYAGVPTSGPGEAAPEEFKPKAEALYRYVAASLLGEYHYVLASGLARGRDSAAFYAAPIHTGSGRRRTPRPRLRGGRRRCAGGRGGV